jgi:hypothetical protein
MYLLLLAVAVAVTQWEVAVALVDCLLAPLLCLLALIQ